MGRALVQAALDAGDFVVATARRPGQLAGFAERYGDRVLPLALDVTDADAVQASRSADYAEPYPAEFPADEPPPER